MDEIKKEYLSTEREEARAFDKNELGKVRVAIAGGFSSYLKMIYIVRFFEWYFATDEAQSITWSGDFKVKQFTKMAFMLDEKGKEGICAVPVDIDAFDQKCVTKDMIQLAFKAIKYFLQNDIGEFVAKADLVNTMHLVEKQFMAGPLVVYKPENGLNDVSIKYEKGLLSGWAMTAFLGSSISYIIIKMAEQIARVDSVYKVTQGDDILYITQDIYGAGAIIAAMSLMKVPINAKKFFLGYNGRSAEFLRNIITPKGIYGYGCRALPSVMWRKPWSNEYVTEREMANTIAAVWIKTARRFRQYDVEWLLLNIRNDLARALKKNGVQVEFLMHSLVINGGLGIDPIVLDYKIEWEERELTKKQIRKNDKIKKAFETNKSKNPIYVAIDRLGRNSIRAGVDQAFQAALITVSTQNTFRAIKSNARETMLVDLKEGRLSTLSSFVKTRMFAEYKLPKRSLPYKDNVIYSNALIQDFLDNRQYDKAIIYIYGTYDQIWDKVRKVFGYNILKQVILDRLKPTLRISVKFSEDLVSLIIGDFFRQWFNRQLVGQKVAHSKFEIFLHDLEYKQELIVERSVEGFVYAI
jgi:hypothetical protein